MLVFTFLVCVGKLVYSMLISVCILMDIVILHNSASICLCIFRAHTPKRQAVADGWWFSPVVCAGCVLGMEIPGQVFLLTCLPWACQVIP